MKTDRLEVYGNQHGNGFRMLGRNGKVTTIEDLSHNKRPDIFNGTFVVFNSRTRNATMIPSCNGMVDVSDSEAATYINHSKLGKEIGKIFSVLPENINLLYVEHAADNNFHMLFGAKNESTMWAIYDPESEKYSYIHNYRRHTLNRRLRNQPIVVYNSDREHLVRALGKRQWKHTSFKSNLGDKSVGSGLKIDDENYKIRVRQALVNLGAISE